MTSTTATGGAEEIQADAATSPRRFWLLYLAAWLGLALFTAACFLTPLIEYAVISPTLDLIINTAAVVIAGSVATRTWVRYVDGGENDELFQAAAFLVLFAGGCLRLFLIADDHALYSGYRLDLADQGPLYAWTLQRSVASIFMLLGAASIVLPWHRISHGRARAIVAIPGLAVVAVSWLVLSNEPLLPALIPPDTLIQLVQPRTILDPTLVTMPFFGTQVAIAMAFAAASIAYARLWTTRRHRPETAYLSVALAIAAFSELHYALVPGAYDTLLTSGDYLRLAFYVTVLSGSAAGVSEDLRRLRRANLDLAELRGADAERIRMIERARLAREVHDGLTQELWLARLTQGRLAAVANMPDEARQIVDRMDGILDRAVAESRQAVVTLQTRSDEGFGDLLRRFVDDYADRFGLNIECAVEIAADAPDAATQSELLRICREALNNVHKHADATVARVTLSIDETGVRLSISDNGKGFDRQRTSARFGLESMRGRAASIGAKITVQSAPMGGTRVFVELDRLGKSP